MLTFAHTWSLAPCQWYAKDQQIESQGQMTIVSTPLSISKVGSPVT